MELEQPKNVLIISHDVVGKQMAGPGIRYYNLARVLSAHCKVVLAIPRESKLETLEFCFPIKIYTRRDWLSIRPLIAEADIIVFPSDIASDFPELRSVSSCLVVDGYDPLLAEWLVLNQQNDVETVVDYWHIRMRQLGHQCLLGDFFICASERQRDWWLGLLEAYGRVNPYTFSEDPSLRRLVDVVPFGLPGEPPRADRPVIRGVWSGIGPEDKILLWGGGLWPWLDPLTAIRAVARIWQHRQDVRLIFPGTRHPNPQLSRIPTHNDKAYRLAQELGLLDRAVFFGKWVPYTDWPGVLLESDLALTLHFDTLETRLAFRSRMLDYIWAGLPIVATRGDATSDLVEKYGLGAVVDYGDDVGVAEAILRLLETPKGAWAARFERARQDLTWERAVQPLLEFCRNPRRAPDKVALGDRLGNPYYLSEVTCLREVIRLRYKNARFQSFVTGCGRERFISPIRWLYRVKQKLELMHRLFNS